MINEKDLKTIKNIKECLEKIKIEKELRDYFKEVEENNIFNKRGDLNE